jgi:hypothetical protein
MKSARGLAQSKSFATDPESKPQNAFPDSVATARLAALFCELNSIDSPAWRPNPNDSAI